MNMQTCPYCGKELERGTLRSRGGNYFLPDGEKAPLLYTKGAMEKRNAIVLPPDLPDLFDLGAPQWPMAYACRSCRKLILPY